MIIFYVIVMETLTYIEFVQKNIRCLQNSS